MKSDWSDEFARLRNDMEDWVTDISENTEMSVTELLPLDRKPLLSVEEASLYLGIGTKKIYQLANNPAADFTLKVGNKILIKRKRFEDFLERSDEI